MKTQYEYRICVFCFCILLCGCLGCYGALDLAKGKSNICYVHDKVMTTEEIGIIYIVTSTMGYPGELERLNDYGEEEYRGQKDTPFANDGVMYTYDGSPCRPSTAIIMVCSECNKIAKSKSLKKKTLPNEKHP